MENTDYQLQTAFPTVPWHNANMETPGMSLLDYFAGQALAGMIGNDWNDIQGHESKIAQICYKQAAAMIEARKNYIK
jgi:hypothetical protein